MKQMKKKSNVLKVFGIVLTAAAVICGGLYFLALSHTQIVVGVIQHFAQGTVNTKNRNEPLHAPYEGVKKNGQYTMTEIHYSDEYPNSYLDITYPDENTDTARPTLIYFHGGGFFGGSKCDGDPLAESDASALLDDLCAEGFNLVNIDYVLVPEYHFPDPLIQANMAFDYLMKHADEYHLDMNRIVIMGSSAGAIMTSQLGSIITNPAYAEELNIISALKPDQVRAVVLDDAPLVYEQFSVGTKILVGNYVKGSIFLNEKEIRDYNNILWVNEDYPPAVLLGSEYYIDMRSMADALTKAGAAHELIDPLAERNLQMPHCFVALERVDETAADAYDRMTAFIIHEVRAK